MFTFFNKFIYFNILLPLQRRYYLTTGWLSCASAYITNIFGKLVSIIQPGLEGNSEKPVVKIVMKKPLPCQEN